jgi:hypothetical protein
VIKVVRENIRCVLALTGVLLVSSCSSDLYDDPIPVVPFVDVNINTANYQVLLTDGGYIYVNDAGVKGVILYRKNSTTFLAFERNCSFRPNDACSTVDVHDSMLYMFDSCCGSSFNFDGVPMGGPAWRPLRQYYTFFDNGTVTITDEIVD